jgi:hypothetical protein
MVAYVNGFAHDVFLSYSSIDNDVHVNDGRGWVDVLHDKLLRQLMPRLGVRDLEVFIDRETMQSNLPITSQLVDAARNSAVLLVLMSPSYLKSPWCDRERSEFLDAVGQRAAGSMVVVRARPVDRDAQPEEFRDLQGVEFFTFASNVARTSRRGPLSDHRVFGDPDPCEQVFCDRIALLAGVLARQIEHMRGAIPGRTRVFLADATGDLGDRNDELRNYLDQAGLDVLPSPLSRYPRTNRADYEAAVLRELETCSLFAQVLGPEPGEAEPFAAGQRLPALQHALARRANKPVLQWRERGQPIDRVADGDHRALLEAAQACGIAEFKHRVATHAKRPPAEPPPPPSAVSVFIDADARDHHLASQVSTALMNLRADCYEIPANGSASDLSTLWESNLKGCDGFMLVYGETEVLWVHSRLRYARKVSSERATPLSAMAVFDGPPRGKPSVSVKISGLEILDCRDGLDAEHLRRFVGLLRR